MSTPSIEDVLARALSDCRDGREHAPDCRPDNLCLYCTSDSKPLADAIRAHLAEHTDEAAGAVERRLVVHIWGFYDDQGNPRQPDSAAAEEGGVYATHRAIEDNVVRHGGTVANLRTTRTLDGELVGTEFDVPAHGDAARIWHRVVRSSEPWGRRAALAGGASGAAEGAGE